MALIFQIIKCIKLRHLWEARCVPKRVSSSDVFDGHLLGSNDSQVKEKSTMKAILATFLPGNSYNSIPFPL